MNWIMDIATFIRGHASQKAAFSDNVFAYHMPAEVQPAALVVPPIDGVPIDHDLKTRFRDDFSVIVRGKDPLQVDTLTSVIKSILVSEEDRMFGELKVQRIRLVAIPNIFPVSESDYYESSLDFEITMIDSRI